MKHTMKTRNTTKRIEQIKSLNRWSTTRFHGNRKMVGQLTVKEINDIVNKKWARALAKQEDWLKKTDIERVKQCIKDSLSSKGTSYFKVFIATEDYIYYASPEYGLRDYNKSRQFPTNERTLKLMRLANAVINR